MARSRPQHQQAATGTALTVGVVVKRFLPYGTVIKATGASSWSPCPQWACDIFAVAAGLVQASSCYAEPGIALSRNKREREAKIQRAKEHIAVGKEWAQSGEVPDIVKKHWNTLYQSFAMPIGDDVDSGKSALWKRAALALVAMSDEACAGVGFFPAANDGIANYVWAELVETFNRTSKGVLELPHSMTLLVPSEVACVLPKSLTPNVGCTLRSLTHHLALLPGINIVTPEWRINSAGDEIFQLISRARSGRTHTRRTSTPDGVFNILLVPFPYVVYATDFEASQPADKESDGYFSLTQDWLRDGTQPVTAGEMAKFIGGLIRNAQRDAGQVHAVVLPELALSEDISDKVAALLARRFRTLELFITGIAMETTKGTRNAAAQYGMVDGEIAFRSKQSKHHRWRLEANQIRQYQLGGVLDPNHIWWEHIDVDRRTIGFGTNRDDAIIAALVCEDLARYDPVLPVVAAVGPTLVVALLLDGPQLPNRWPGRYATVLAEDPGSSVLTLTNLGMIERSAIPGSGK